jgi:N-acylglucosamine-6-phosphate 2-epimerase
MSASPFDISNLRGGLIVSCQSEGEDPFNRAESIARFARAAEMGGAVGIRARQAENIAAVKAAVELPVIGITKSEYPDGSVLITPGLADVEAVMTAGAEIVAMDATSRRRPNGMDGCAFLQHVKTKYDVTIMADVATLEEGLAAAAAGADFVGPTLHGYTPYTQRPASGEPDWALLEALVTQAVAPVIMEGGIWTPAQARKALDLGVFAVVVGTAITRPRVITQVFVEAMQSKSE